MTLRGDEFQNSALDLSPAPGLRVSPSPCTLSSLPSHFHSLKRPRIQLHPRLDCNFCKRLHLRIREQQSPMLAAEVSPHPLHLRPGTSPPHSLALDIVQHRLHVLQPAIGPWAKSPSRSASAPNALEEKRRRALLAGRNFIPPAPHRRQRSPNIGAQQFIDQRSPYPLCCPNGITPPTCVGSVVSFPSLSTPTRR